MRMPNIMEFGNKVLSKELLSLLYESDKTVGTAESCTAGGIASAITMVPGASNYFKGGIISYWDDVKTNVLGVDAEVIAENTAVCEEACEADGARSNQHSWCGLCCGINRFCRSRF